jgi:hypothetical protein
VTDHQAPDAIEQAIIDALVAHRVDREGPDFDYADPSLLGYTRAVARVARTEADAAYERGKAEGLQRALKAVARHIGVEPEDVDPEERITLTWDGYRSLIDHAGGTSA